MRFKSRLPRSGKALGALFSGLAMVAGSQAAFAQSDAHPAAGVLKLSNVRIQAATAQQLAQAQGVARTDNAVRAYIDPATGQLRPQSPEEAMEQGAVRSTKKGKAVAQTPIASPHGGISIPLNNTHMVDAVVTRDANGNLDMQCVTGHGAAGKVDRHDR